MKFIKYKKHIEEAIDISKLHSMADLANIDEEDLEESKSLTEAKEDIDAFINKFGKENYDFITKYKQRFINNKLSTDLRFHNKNTSREEMDKIVSDLSNKVVKDEKGETKLNYNYLGESKGYKVYEILDWETAMNMGEGTGWCIAGRYETDEVKPSQAKQYFNEYTEDGYKFYYLIGKDKYCLQMGEKDGVFRMIDSSGSVWECNFFIWNQEDTIVNDTNIFIKLPINLIKDVYLHKLPDFEIKDGVLVKYNGSQSGVVISDSITSIGRSAFSDCSKLTSITIPSSITSIGSYAFNKCTSLNGVKIPDSVTGIGAGVFNQCISLTDITIPNSVTSIGGGAFSYCNSLTSITIPDNIKIIEKAVFSFCSKLKSITIPNGVTSIEGHAFYECSNLTNIKIPNSVTNIGEGAFSYCRSLTIITIPDNVISIGSGAFRSCSSLTSVIIPNSVKSVGTYAFHNCAKLSHIIYKDTAKQYVKFIGDNRLFDLFDCKVTLADGSTYDSASNVLQKAKETNESYADKEERNYRRQINASNKLKDNKEKVLGKLSDSVIDTIESIVTHRHDLHKTDRENGNALIYHMNDLYDDMQQLPEDVRPHISFLDTDPRESEDVPLDFASDFFDSKDLCDFFLGEDKYETEEDGTPTDEAIDNAFIELYRYNDMIVETINTEIENWLGQIDKKYGTSYRPTGSNRLL